MESLRKSKYSIAVVTIWLFVSTYFFFFISEPFSYFSFHKSDLVIFFPITICALVSLFIVNRFIHFGEVTINKKGLLQTFLIFFYAIVLISLPEEIIFRGFIQNNLKSIISDIGMVIVLSSIIFGIAHIPNGAHSFMPRGWNWKLMVMSFVAGLYLGFAYLITGSLVIPIILHTLIIVVAKLFVKNY